MSRAARLVVIAAGVLGASAPSAAVAQQATEYRPAPIPASMEELEAREAELLVLLDGLVETAEESVEAVRSERIEVMRARASTERVGPFTVMALEEDLDRAAELVRRAWEGFVPLLGNDADYFEGALVRGARPDGPLFPEPREEGAPPVLDFWMPTEGEELSPDGWPVRGSIQAALNRAAAENGKRNLIYWLNGGGVGEDSDRRELWSALVTSTSPSGPACLEGSVRDCVIALGLDPERDGERRNYLERLQEFYGLESVEAVLDYWLTPRARAVRRYTNTGWIGFLRACLEDPSDAAARYGNSTTCDDMYDDPGYQFESSLGDNEIPAALRRSLLNHALLVGPPGGIQRLADYRLPPSGESGERTLREFEGVFESVAQMPLEDLMASWHEEHFGDGIQNGGPGSHEAPMALFWAGFFVTFSFLSTRRRFG